MVNRNTKQKEFVLNNLKNRFDHPTSQQIYDDAKKQGIKIGQVSIYRILNNLVKEGLVCKIVTKDNVAHFDYLRKNHIHLVCNNCNQIFDKNLGNDDNLTELINEFNISMQDVILYGICKNCKNCKNNNVK